MAVNTAPYQDPPNSGKWTIDKDPDDKLNYVADVTQFLSDSGTSAASFEVVTDGSVSLLQKGAPQGDRSGLLPVKLTGAPGSCTFRVTTADGQQFDKTIYFKSVSN